MSSETCYKKQASQGPNICYVIQVQQTQKPSKNKKTVTCKENRIKVTAFGRKWRVVQTTENWRTYDHQKADAITLLRWLLPT